MIDKRVVALVLCVCARSVAAAQAAPRDTIEDERAYAVAIIAVADSAIHRLDFFPSRAQLRVQTAFLSERVDQTSVPFGQIAKMSAQAAFAIDGGAQRFAAFAVPPDLKGLHRDLTKALRAATAAADHLAAAASVCQTAMASIQQCQSPFTAASTQFANAYRDYLAVRAKIANQILDTQTQLAEFRVASRGL